MKSSICYLGKKTGKKTVLDEVEKTAQYNGLNDTDSLRLRLLAEELTELTAGIVGKYQAQFWIEAERKKFKLNLQIEMETDAKKREQLIGISTDHRNAAAKGVMGRIRTFLEDCVCNYEETGLYCAKNGIDMADLGNMYSASKINNQQLAWSLSGYAREISRENHPEEWDELEKSIVANLADDIRVSILGKKIEIVVKKSFK